LLKLEKKFGVNVCGEGGEYETYTLDSPLFIKKLNLTKRTVVHHTTDPFAPVSYLHLDELELVNKDVPEGLSQQQRLDYYGIKGLEPESYLEDLQRTNICNKSSSTADRLFIELKQPEISSNFGEEDWFEILSLQGYGDTAGECMESVARLLDTQLQQVGATRKDLIRTKVYIDRMENYAEINNVYVQQFGLNPPVRVCVAVGNKNVPKGCKVSMDVRGKKQESPGGDDRRCLHVQGISHWAPANIGPYSQGYLAGEYLHVSGQIGLIPGIMTLHPEADLELDLAYRHAFRVQEAMAPAGCDIHSAVCYIVDQANSSLVQSYWQEKSLDCSVTVVLVEQLPKAANFEWEIVYKVNIL